MLAPTLLRDLSSNLTNSLPSDECELKDFFRSLHSFKQGSESSDLSPLSSVSSGSTSEDEIENVFALDKDGYDFESQLPPSVIFNIQEMLNELDDTYEVRFGDNHTELNPRAAPFVPSLKGNQLAEAAPRPSRQPDCPILEARALACSTAFPLPPIPPAPAKLLAPWLTIFHTASTIPPTNTTALAESAMNLAHCNLWHTDALAELAQHFCWKASAANSDVIRETMAPFAWETYRALGNAFDDDTANSFVWHLRESLLGTFKGCWCSTESTKSISYRFTPSEEYVVSATWLIAFIGDLFNFDLIRVQHIKLCFSILVHELSSLEHVTAISVLINHAGPQFWCYPGGMASHMPMAMTKEPSREMIHMFLKSFLPKTVMLQNGSSVLARTVVAGTREKEDKVQEVMNLLAQWCPDLIAI